MSNDEKYIEVHVSQEEIRVRLKKLLNSEYSDLISQVIIDNLETTEMGLAQLYKSFSGLKETYKYLPGKSVWVDKHTLYSWRIDDDASEKEGYMKQEKVKCMITQICRTVKKPYLVEYTYVNKEGQVVEEKTYVEERYLSPVDEYPLNL